MRVGVANGVPPLVTPLMRQPVTKLREAIRGLATKGVAGAIHAEAQEADGIATQAQGDVPALSIAAAGSGGGTVELINPVLRGRVGYFAIGHSSRWFGFIKDWVEKKARRHLRRARKRQGFGWNRWSRQCLYETVRLFHRYRVNYAAR